jgi:hypothetical protein
MRTRGCPLTSKCLCEVLLPILVKRLEHIWESIHEHRNIAELVIMVNTGCFSFDMLLVNAPKLTCHD